MQPATTREKTDGHAIILAWAAHSNPSKMTMWYNKRAGAGRGARVDATASFVACRPAGICFQRGGARITLG